MDPLRVAPKVSPVSKASWKLLHPAAWGSRPDPARCFPLVRPLAASFAGSPRARAFQCMEFIEISLKLMSLATHDRDRGQGPIAWHAIVVAWFR